MSSRTEIDRALDEFFGEGPEKVADQALLRTFDAIDRTKQRRDLLAPWRFSLMSLNPRLATVMLVAVVAVGGAAYLLGQHSASGSGAVVPTPTVTPSPAPTASPVAVLPSPTVYDPTGWVKFTSRSYGFSVSHPTDWTEQPATQRWTYPAAPDAGVETLWSPSGWPEFTGLETRIPAGMTADTFLQAYTADAQKTACYPGSAQWIPTTIDGHAARIANAGCNEHFYWAEAITVIGGRVWFFDLIGPDRSMILPFLATVKFDLASLTD